MECLECLESCCRLGESHCGLVDSSLTVEKLCTVHCALCTNCALWKKLVCADSIMKQLRFLSLLSFFRIATPIEMIQSVNLSRCPEASLDLTNVTKSSSVLSGGMELKRTHFKIIDSSQTRCKEICNDPSKEMLKALFEHEDYSANTLYLLSSDMQTSSYGRSNRTWHSVEGNFMGTYMIVWPDKKLRLLPSASSAVALAVAATIEEFNLPAEIKWTNDVLIHGKKASGILCDALPVTDGMMVLIGIGLNVNMDAAVALEKFRATSDELKIEFTSMSMNSGIFYNLEDVSSRLSKNLARRLQSVLAGDFGKDLLPEVQSRLAFRGMRITFSDETETLDNVIFEGITSEGFAIIRDLKGQKYVKLTGRIRPQD